MNQVWPASLRKRGRDDDPIESAPAGTMGFTEHRSKRLQALPLRSSSSKRAEAPMFPPPVFRDFSLPDPPRVITPGPSPLAEPESFEEWADEPELVAASADLEMMDFEPSDLTHLGHGPSQPDADATGQSISGRMPTPIQCSFAQQVRGSNWTNDPPVLPNTPQRATTIIGYESVPRSLDGPAATAQVMADWSHVQNRRLPSPISESGGEDSPHIILDSSPFQQVTGGHLSQVTHDHPMLSTLPRAWTGSSSATLVPSSPKSDSSSVQESMEWSPMAAHGESGSPLSAGRKGHTRSKHTVNSWTPLQPGMKRSLSIGYRADCEKCRMKVDEDGDTQIRFEGRRTQIESDGSNSGYDSDSDDSGPVSGSLNRPSASQRANPSANVDATMADTETSFRLVNTSTSTADTSVSRRLFTSRPNPAGGVTGSSNATSSGLEISQPVNARPDGFGNLFGPVHENPFVTSGSHLFSSRSNTVSSASGSSNWASGSSGFQPSVAHSLTPAAASSSTNTSGDGQTVSRKTWGKTPEWDRFF